MKIIKYDPENKASIVAEALVVLMSGGTVVYPTETAYALGADFFSPHAYTSIFSIKFRSGAKPLPVLVPDFHYATTVVEFPPEASRLASRYWPGPLTLVLPFIYSKEWPHHKDKFLALRVSSHPFAQSLSRAFGKPLISTSANVAGEPPAYSVEDFVRQVQKRKKIPDLIIDAGALSHVLPSTIIKVDKTGSVVLREGPVKIE